MNGKFASEKVTVADSSEAVNNLYIEKGWSDGLPIIPPTEPALEKMLSGTKREPSEVLAKIGELLIEFGADKSPIDGVDF